MKRINLYFKTQPQPDRYFPGDHHLFSIARKLFRKKKVSGVHKVFDSLCLGFDQLGIGYTINLPFKKIKPDEPVVVLGVGRYALQGYTQPNPVIAGIGLMSHPAEWPDLFTQYPVVKYLQHSAWANNMYAAYYGTVNCDIWPAGIDTQKWAPILPPVKKTDILIYNKVMWDKVQTNQVLRQPILDKLSNMGITYHEIIYGHYTEAEYHALLQECRAMIFLCEHESQGFACCEALAMDVPVLAWDQGYWLDPYRIKWGTPEIKATSVPYFDDRCGETFTHITDFNLQFQPFWDKVLNHQYQPRNYILENLTLEKSAQKMLDIIDEIYY